MLSVQEQAVYWNCQQGFGAGSIFSVKNSCCQVFRDDADSLPVAVCPGMLPFCDRFLGGLLVVVHAHGTATPAGRFLQGDAGLVMQAYIDLHEGIGQFVA